MATPEEIRHAHRRLVKILHPDLQIEDLPRQLAEIQTRRINAIAQILLDPARRTAYDGSLLPPLGQHSSGRPWYYPVTAFAIIGLSLTLGLAAMFQLNRTPVAQEPLTNAPLQTGSLKASPSPSQTSGLHGNREMLPQPDKALTDKILRANPERVEKIASVGADPINAEPETSQLGRLSRPVVLPTLETGVTKAQSTASPVQVENPLIGTWIYLPVASGEEDGNLYRPEYIEMRIRLIRGVLDGQYRARYHVPDRPLSPNVGFHFAGQSGEGSSAFRWNGSNGVAGQVQLKLMTANSIQVDWRVTELAESADLVSGTAVLTRVQ